jgi:hypothetical protein
MVILSTSCERSEPAPMPFSPPSVSAGQLRSLVIGAAAEALDETGQFTMPALAWAGGRLLSEAEAKTLSVAWVQQFGPFHWRRLESDRGAAIDFAGLTACQRAFLADTPYEPTPADIPNPVRHLLGPFWLVPMCDKAVRPTVLVALAATATSVTHTVRYVIPADDRGGTNTRASLTIAVRGDRSVQFEAITLGAGGSQP